MTQLIPKLPNGEKDRLLEVIEPLIETTLNAVNSTNTKIAYRTSLTDFLSWHSQSNYTEMNAAAVNGYVQSLVDAGKARSTINQRLAAIKKLATQLHANGIIDPVIAWGISQIGGKPIRGQDVGTWLTTEEAQNLIVHPLRLANDDESNIGRLRGLRDQAIIATFIGAGLRRSEVASLTFKHIQKREGRWAIVNLHGKGGRVRTIGIPLFVYDAIRRWSYGAGLNLNSSEKIFKAIKKGKYGTLTGSLIAGGPRPYTSDGALTPQAVYKIIKFYAAEIDIDIAVHDLRRTSANLMLRSGAEIRQIQQLLGHESIVTTERYLAPMISVRESAADYIRITLDI